MHGLELDTMVLGPIATNTYIPYNRETKECVLIDPAAMPEQIEARLKKQGLTPRAILLTHGHFDHILAVRALQEQLGLPVYAHGSEADMLAHPERSSVPMDLRGFGVTDYKPVRDGEMLDLIGFKWKVIHTPGHSCGSVCYYIEEEQVIFSGDTIFYHTYGRTDFPTGSFSEIVDSIKNKVFARLDGDIDIFPGHGESTTLKEEKKKNAILTDG